MSRFCLIELSTNRKKHTQLFYQSCVWCNILQSIHKGILAQAAEDVFDVHLINKF